MRASPKAARRSARHDAGATRGGTADALLQEMSESQPMLLNWMRSFVVRMPPKAYRWVAEMEEIAEFQRDDPGAAAMYHGIAQFYQQIADVVAEPKSGDAVAQLKDFCAERARPNARARKRLLIRKDVDLWWVGGWSGGRMVVPTTHQPRRIKMSTSIGLTHPRERVCHGSHGV